MRLIQVKEQPVENTISQFFTDANWLDWILSLCVALIIFYVGRILAKLCAGIANKAMLARKIDEPLRLFISALVRSSLTFVALLVALDYLGFDTTSLLALFAAAGLAIGLALKDSLSNFAAGVMLILFKPFGIGDFVEAAGTSGVVEGIGIFSTQMRTGDNRAIIVPNSHIYGGVIINVSAKPTRRIDLVVGVGYEDDLQLVEQTLHQIIASEGRILAEPGVTIAVAELADSSVNFVVRPWVNSADYWDVRFALLGNIKASFDNKGISIPYPQQDVHVHQTKV